MREAKLPARPRFFRMLAKRVVNPIARQGVRLGIAPGSIAVLETVGRRSGRPRQTPVLNGLDGDTFWLFAEHGHQADYVKNLIANPRVRVLAGGRWRAGTATVLPDVTTMERRREIERRHGLMGRLDGLTFRASAFNPVAIRIDLD